jgi:hypothetical protein
VHVHCTRGTQPRPVYPHTPKTEKTTKKQEGDLPKIILGTSTVY